MVLKVPIDIDSAERLVKETPGQRDPGDGSDEAGGLLYLGPMEQSRGRNGSRLQLGGSGHGCPHGALGFRSGWGTAERF